MLNEFPITRGQILTNETEAVEYAQYLYQDSCQKIQTAFQALLDGVIDEQALQDATYPFLGIKVLPQDLYLDAKLSFGVIRESGHYGVTITRPDIFKDYYQEQLKLLIARHQVPIVVGSSYVPIPLSFVMGHMPLNLNIDPLARLKSGLVLPNLNRIDDRVPNGVSHGHSVGLNPLALFTAERVDFSLHRLQHYTATSPEHFQKFIVLTNYQSYSDAFIDYSREQLRQKNGYTALIGPGNTLLAADNDPDKMADSLAHLPQMPAYHLRRQDGQGITFINIGVGPSNAKTITDHLAVLRPHCWLMLGHCAGLRSTQMLGDYVLAHAYVREDHVLDQDLPLWVPLPPIEEVQIALQQAVINVVDEPGTD